MSDSDSDSSVDLFGLGGATSLSLDEAAYPVSLAPFVAELASIEAAILASQPPPPAGLLAPDCYRLLGLFHAGEYLQVLATSPLLLAPGFFPAAPSLPALSAKTAEYLSLHQSGPASSDQSHASSSLQALLAALAAFNLHLQLN
jgi:hypothetical protein